MTFSSRKWVFECLTVTTRNAQARKRKIRTKQVISVVYKSSEWKREIY